MIPYGRQDIDEDDIQSVVEVLRSPFLTTGPKVREFEAAVAQRVGAKEAVAMSSGTAGLHAAMDATGIGPGDEVLVPALSFVATANAVLFVGAKPVFVDSLPGEFNLDPSDAARKITSKTRAIVPVHFAGQPVDLKAIHALASKHKLAVIEDAAHALGAVYDGKPIGCHSTMTVLSFHPVKHITTGEGGLVTTQDPELARRLRRFRHHGIDTDVVQRDATNQWYYDMQTLGYNYRITDFQCALGLSQLRKLDMFLKRRRDIVSTYDRAFQDGKVGAPPPREDLQNHAWHLYVLRLRDAKPGHRDRVFAELRRLGVGAHVHYRPIYLHSFYQKQGWKAGHCPEIEKTFQSMLTLPLFSSMTPEMVETVIDALRNVTSTIA